MGHEDPGRARPRSSIWVLQELARALAECEPRFDDLLACVVAGLNGAGFGFDRVAIFRDGTGRFDPVPAAQRGFDDLEVLHGQLPSVEGWSLFRRALETESAVWAADAQLDGDVPLEVAGSLRLRSVVGIPFLAGGACLGFGLADRGGTAFELSEDELEALTTAGRFVAAALHGARAQDRERRASELKSQFIALASHELRAPVAGIHGVTTTLRERGDDLKPEQVEILQRTLYEQSDRMRRLVDQLLDLSKLEAEAVEIRPARFAVLDRVESVLRQVAPDKLELVQLAVEPGLETTADPDAFDRILANLVTNAFRYGAPPVRVAAQQLDTHFRLWVEDAGDGVPPSFAPRLFERFARGRQDGRDGGSGLGLAIAQSFAQAQGGRLLYEDAQPKGARFQLVLPVGRHDEQ
ncbi:MAG TPA: ATP-binding protein [Gaiellaceae bacterium]|nr:ATP-binding protein [Gaiellaceae bacterium]